MAHMWVPAHFRRQRLLLKILVWALGHEGFKIQGSEEPTSRMTGTFVRGPSYGYGD